jgi:hypothetical protein
VLAESALVALAGVGFAAVADVPAVTMAAPSSCAQAGWLLRNGVPWALRRSVDLLPALRRPASLARDTPDGAVVR